MRITACSAEEIEELGTRLGSHPRNDMTAMKCVVDGEIVAAAGFDDWTESSCTVHIWIGNTKALNHGTFVNEVFDYVFRQTDRTIATGRTPDTNEDSLKFQKWLGFVEVARIPDGWAEGEDIVITQLRKENCKFKRKVS